MIPVKKICPLQSGHLFGTKIRIRTLLIGFFLFSRIQGATGFSQPADQTGVPLFSSDSLIYITLVADFRAISLDVEEEGSWHNARLLLSLPGGQQQEFEVELKTRGNFRRNRETCDFPPLRIRFEKEEVSGTLFHDQTRLKMVTHCKSGLPAYEQFYIKEYLLYRVYNLLTDLSFRVRPAVVTYVDESGRGTDLVKFTFFLEDNDDLAARNHGKITNVPGIAQYKTDYHQMAVFTMFQYMIGNTDWSVPELHNLELFSPDSGGPIRVIPYDFDFSGSVNAPYATPDPKLEIATVRQRLYRDFCRPRNELDTVFLKFLSIREEVYRLYEEMPLLNERTRKQALMYFDKFYDTIQNEKKIRKEFMRSCRGEAPVE